MPSHSVKQAKVMSAISHGWHPSGLDIPVKVAKEFHAADAGHKYGKGHDKKALRIAKRQAKKYADGGDVGLSEADQAAMMPETYVNPLVKQKLSQLFSAPQKAIENSQYSVDTGNYDPGPTMDATRLAMTGGFSGVPGRGVALGSGPISNKFKRSAEDVSNKFGKDQAVVKQKYWTQVKPFPKTTEELESLDSIFAKQNNVPQPQMSTEEAMAAIEKALNESTPESFAATGPSSPVKPTNDLSGYNDYFHDLGAFPNVVPFQSPYKAMSQGYVTPAVHGTRLGADQWKTLAEGKMGEPGDALRLPGDELGVHFGTPDQARDFTGMSVGPGVSPRTYPVVLQTGKSLELPDMGTWHTSKINDALDQLNRGKGYGVDSGEFKVADRTAHIGKFPSEERNKIDSIKDMRGYLQSKGYDSVNYINKVEGPGQRSYIMFKPGDDERFVSGVRSPFAKFDKSKMHRPDLAAGIVGTVGAAGAGAAAMMPQNDKGKASGGKVGNFDPERGAAIGLARQGMIQSQVPGRTDKLNLNVPTGSYIIPGDTVSALGQGNSMAGSDILHRIFNSGPYGMSLPRSKSGMRVGNRKSTLSMQMHMAKGGKASTSPIVAAGGEWIVHPESVAALGHGDIKLGHNILDAFIKHVRAKNIKELKGLKPPKGSKK